MAYNWQGQTHPATQQDVALRYRRLPSDQLPRLLGAALRAGATSEDGVGAGGQQQPPQAQQQQQLMLHHGRHGRGATLGAYGSGSVRVASVLSAVRGDESSVRFCVGGGGGRARACPVF